MTLSQQSWLYRYAYLMTSSHNIPEHGGWRQKTDLCHLFWRCVLLQPIKLLVVGAVSGELFFVTFILLPMKLHTWWAALIIPAGVAGVVGIVWLCLWSKDRLKARMRRRPARPPSKVKALAREFYRGVKERYCPIIEIEA